MTDRWTPSQLAGTIRWVLAVEYAGGTWYLTDEAMTIAYGAGTVVLSDGLLDVAGTEESIDLWASDSPRRSCQVEFDLGIDVAELVERGHDLAGCVAELAQLADGDDWADRRPFVRGRLVEPQYGAAGEGVRASIEQDVLSSDETINISTVREEDLEAALLATGIYFSAGTAGADVAAPIILGAPGAGVFPGSNAPYCETMYDSVGLVYRFYVLAAHPVAAPTVTLVNPDDLSEQSCAVLHVTIGGDTIAVAVEDATLSALTFTKQPVVRWDAGGGLVDEVSGDLETVGDFIAWLLRITEQQVDHARVNMAREALRGFKAGTYLDESVTIADYLRDAILDVVPVSFVVGPRGVYPYVWRWDATTADAVCEWDLTEDYDVSREGLVTYEDGDRVTNTIQLIYQWNPATQSYGGEIWAVGDPATRPRGLRSGRLATLTRSFWADPVLARSVSRYGVRRETVETAVVADTLTAQRVLAWRSRRWALPSRVVQYTAAQRWGWIEPGDFVVITDPELAWSKRLCLVQSRAWAEDGSVRYTLRVQEG